jgi:hypothetical protein
MRHWSHVALSIYLSIYLSMMVGLGGTTVELEVVHPQFGRRVTWPLDKLQSIVAEAKGKEHYLRMSAS